jgi:hypothetical protein
MLKLWAVERKKMEWGLKQEQVQSKGRWLCLGSQMQHYPSSCWFSLAPLHEQGSMQSPEDELVARAACLEVSLAVQQKSMSWSTNLPLYATAAR